eukprot:gene414-524_t
MNNFDHTISLNVATNKIFNAITDGIPLWWTQMYEGSGNKQNDIFTIKFGEAVFKTMRVQELVENSKIVWYVENSKLGIPELKNQTEWIGTTIVWQITEKENGAELHITHIGLSPNVECYETCTAGWNQFLNSLTLFLETGHGKPFLV